LLSGLLTCVIGLNLQAREIDFEDLPGTRHLAAALSDPESRTDTLLTMIAVERLLDYGAISRTVDQDTLHSRFRDERTWLDRLTGHYLELPTRGSQLDPAAWFVVLELDQHQMSPGPAVSPTGPRAASLLRQLFDRSQERLSAAILPGVLQRMEFRAVDIWQDLLDTAASNEALMAIVSGLDEEWFDPWIAAEPPAPTGQSGWENLASESMTALAAMAASSTVAGPPDSLRLKRLRFNLLLALPELDDRQARDVAYLLRLASAVDGLRHDRYLAFTESLLWIVSDLLMTQAVPAPPLPESILPLDLASPPPAEAEGEIVPHAGATAPGVTSVSPLPRLLSELLPGVSNAYAAEFSDVDPRLNANLAAVFDTVQYLREGQPDRARLTSLRKNIADAVAQLVLLLPEMDYYYQQPVRQRISEEIDICISIAVSRNVTDVAKLSREQFDGCMQSLVEIAGTLILREELAGDADGPFGVDQLRRELRLPAWQRINYSHGYLLERFSTGCDAPGEPFPNPLEWASLANMVVWFAGQSPLYFNTPANEDLVVRMRQQGMELIQGMHQQVDCISGAAAGIEDPVARSIADYSEALENLVGGLREAELKFRESRLMAGADVVLHGDAFQQTAYRAEDLAIGPCNPDRICEMKGELETTRALIGLFPDPYLIADQTGLGKVEICYENMQWVNRRAEPVRQEDPFVANYFGQLSFDLIGRYYEKDEVKNVFGSNFVSPDEYHYLFAAATDEVREDSCPTEWVGTKIVTGLGKSGNFRVVPDRLTYLASARKKPSEIMVSNWSRGAEWRDWFVTGLGVVRHEYPDDEGISGRINQHLQALYQAEQAELYTALLRPRTRSTGSSPSALYALQSELTVRKSLVRAYISLFYPEFLIGSDEIRGSLEGYGALLDSKVLRRFREENLAVSSINRQGLERLEEFKAQWSRQPESVRRSGSISTSVAHALMRLNELYIDFFNQKKLMTPSGLRG
jgi:hypothetical protein